MPPADEQLWILAGLGLFAAILALIVRSMMRTRPQPIPVEGPLRLTIKPLKELRPDPNHLYLGTTIARELTTRLKGFERLEPHMGDGGSVLCVEGNVRKFGPRLVIVLRLANSRHQVWRGTYDGSINDLGYMSDKMAANVAHALKVAPRKKAAQPEGQKATAK
jgi:TolB-like protein